MPTPCVLLHVSTNVLKQKGLRLLWRHRTRLSRGLTPYGERHMWRLTPFVVSADGVGGGARSAYGDAVLSMPHEAEGVRPSFFRRWRSVDAGKSRISAAPPGPATRPWVCRRTSAIYARSIAVNVVQARAVTLSRPHTAASAPVLSGTSTVSTSPSANKTARSMMCSNSRTLPCHG